MAATKETEDEWWQQETTDQDVQQWVQEAETKATEATVIEATEAMTTEVA